MKGMAGFDVTNISFGAGLTFDAPKSSAPREMLRLSSLRDLDPFLRVAQDLLVKKATKEFWSLQKGPNGDFFAVRCD